MLASARTDLPLILLKLAALSPAALGGSPGWHAEVSIGTAERTASVELLVDEYALLTRSRLP
jgi:hypothetical protein